MQSRSRQRQAPRQLPRAAGANAYVKAVSGEGETVYAVFTADGRLIGIAPTRSLALFAARQASLEPVDAH